MGIRLFFPEIVTAEQRYGVPNFPNIPLTFDKGAKRKAETKLEDPERFKRVAV